MIIIPVNYAEVQKHRGKTPRHMVIHGRNCANFEKSAIESGPKGDIIHNGLKILRKKPEKLTLCLKSSKYRYLKFFDFEVWSFKKEAPSRIEFMLANIAYS